MPRQIVIFVGDPAQLPPVIEGDSRYQFTGASMLLPITEVAFSTGARFAGPLLLRATEIRELDEGCQRRRPERA